jgi:hypothetical protein
MNHVLSLKNAVYSFTSLSFLIKMEEEYPKYNRQKKG